MSMLDNVAKVLTFNALQTVFSKILGAVQLAILIRLLTNSDIGAVGLVAGYVGVLGFLAIAPEVIFLRDYQKMAARLNDYLSSFLLFGVARGFVLVLVGIPLAYWLFISQSAEVAVYFLLVLLAFSLNLLTSPFREAFYAQFRQGRIAWIDLSLNLLSLLLIALVFFYQNIVAYGIVQVAVGMLGVVWWYSQARTHLKFKFLLHADWWKLSWGSLTNFSIWNHFTSTSLRMVYQADVVVLSFFVALDPLGDYAVALTIANVFFVFPQLIQKVTSLSFSSLQKKEELELGLGLSVKYNFLFCFAQFIGFLIFGPWLVAFFGPENPENVLTYAFYLVGGVTLFSFARPWIALLIVRYDMRKLFMELFVVFGLFAFIVYYLAAAYGGVVGVAQSNVLLYFVLALLVIYFTGKKLNIYPRIVWITIEEKRFFMKQKDKLYKLLNRTKRTRRSK